MSRVVPAPDLWPEALETATLIASYDKGIAMMARACVREAEETGLGAGLRFERQTYHALYGSDAQREGMAAFLDKRRPEFRPAPVAAEQ